MQTFTTDGANELASITRNTDLLTVAGSLSSAPTSLTINGQAATVYGDLTYAATNGVPIVSGLNQFTAVLNGTLTNHTLAVLPVTTPLRYDATGNLVYDGLKAYGYDCANELTSITVTNLLRTEYVYDGFGRRRIRRDFSYQRTNGVYALTNEVRYVYDGMLVLQERNGSNAPVVTYTRGLDVSGTLQGAGGIGGLLARTDGNSTNYYHADGNGNITALINASGTETGRYLYDPYGNLLGLWGAAALGNTYRFSSKEWDLRTDVYYYGYRYYQPNLQRWLNRDPLEEAGGINLYGFNSNNTLSLIDSDGAAPQLTGIIYNTSTGTSDPQYQQNSYFGDSYGIGKHTPLDPSTLQLAQQNFQTAANLTYDPNASAMDAAPYYLKGFGFGILGTLELVLPFDALLDRTAGKVCSKVAPAGQIPTIGGRLPINSSYAGTTHPSGVEFTAQGFPNFSPYAEAEVQLDGLTGNYTKDAARANQAVGLDSTPEGYVWHHVEDGETMQLVPQEIHNSTRHTGGAAVIGNGGFDP